MLKISFPIFAVILFLGLNKGIASWYNIHPKSVQETTAPKNTHNDRGLRRIVRIKGITICLADGVDGHANNEGIYRSTDNGNHWELIGSIKGATRGTIVAGPSHMVFIFWVRAEGNSPGIYFTKFRIDQIPPSPWPIYKGYVKSVGYDGGYQDTSSAVDSKGTIYVVAHFPKMEGEADGLWLLKSKNGGKTWGPPKLIASEQGTSFAYPALEVDRADNLIMTFAEHSPKYLGGREDVDKRIYFMKSNSGGDHWSKFLQVDSAEGPFGVYNPCIIEDMQSNLYIFGQRAFQGLVMAKSEDGGNHWTGFSLIVPTSNYADPSVAIGNDDTIYVLFRDDIANADSSQTTYNSTIAASKDQGQNWSIVFRFYDQGKVGPGLSMRYANWWNYGGPLEWCWQQYLVQDKSSKPVFYAINFDVTIFNRLAVDPFRSK